MEPIADYSIKRIQTPLEKDIDSDIEWVCASLGFMGSRDADHTALKIITALVMELRIGKGLTSEEITERVKPTRGSVIYHLKRLMKAGIVIKSNSHYTLRQRSFEKTIEDVQSEMNLAFEEVKRITREIDEKLGTVSR